MINLREWALPLYTIMMQMAAGTMLTLWTVYTLTARRHGQATAERLSRYLVTIIFVTVAVSMVGSHFHLSRPFYSFFALSNIGSSWLSREIMFTVLFAFSVGVLWLGQLTGLLGARARLIIGWIAVAFGIITVYCMANVYMLPTQIAWNTPATPIMFFSTTILLGSLAIAALLLMTLYLADLQQEPNLDTQAAIVQRILRWCARWVILAATIELLTMLWQINTLSNGDTAAQTSVTLLLELYQILFIIRMALLIIGVSAFGGLILRQHHTQQPITTLMTPIYFTFLGVLVGEVLGRFLFYAIHVRSGI